MDQHESKAEPINSSTVEVTRRTVIEAGTTALPLTALPRAALAAGSVDDDGAVPCHSRGGRTLQIIGDPHSPTWIFLHDTLLDALREHLVLTGTKKGCDHGQCWRLYGVDRGSP